jgi:hypothetical protein
MSHDQLFDFESDFVASLRCIPMAVRFKLDLAGVKLSLRQWSRFTEGDRRALLLQPCATPAAIDNYRTILIELVATRAGEVAKPLPEEPCDLWREPAAIPAAVVERALDHGLAPPGQAQWAQLTDLQRFVLLKLTRAGHDNVNFAPAMREFGLSAHLGTAHLASPAMSAFPARVQSAKRVSADPQTPWAVGVSLIAACIVLMMFGASRKTDAHSTKNEVCAEFRTACAMAK